MGNVPLMPKATAVWLVENTTLTFKQIADFCGLHPLEVQGIADGDVATGIIGDDPVAKGLITKEMLEAAIEDENAKLQLVSDYDTYITAQKKVKSRYTPVARRQDKPDAIAWLIKNHPDMSDAQISKLVGTTKNTIQAIRNREHWNMQNIRPRDPVLLGLCLQSDLQVVIDKIEKDKERAAEKAEKELRKQEREKARKKAEKEAAKAKKKAADDNKKAANG